MKICIVSSSGGHLTEVRELLPAYRGYPHFYVLNQEVVLPEDMQGITYFIRHSERDFLFFVNLIEAWKIFRRERPDVILSTGAGPVVPFAVIGRIFFRTRCIFVETVTRVRVPSLSGRIMYRLADRFFYQSSGLSKFFPKGEFSGSVL